jgi:hypothetical protein
MKVEAEDEGGDRENGENAVVEREDAEDAAGVELAEEAGIGKRVVEDSGN